MIVELFKNVGPESLAMLRHAGRTETHEPGKTIFRENDPADGLYIIIDGRVEVYRETERGETSIARLEKFEIFGEMGMLQETRLRGASVRAHTRAIVAKIPFDIMAMMKKYAKPEDAYAVYCNVMSILRRRLESNRLLPAAPNKSPWDIYRRWHGDGEDVLARIRKHLQGKGILRGMKRIQLAQGEYLCREGERAEAFYYLHQGTLEVLVEDDMEVETEKAEVQAPAIAGEIAFFSGERRLASLRATTPVEYTPFGTGGYAELFKKDAAAALDLFHAALQLLVLTIARQQNPAPKDNGR